MREAEKAPHPIRETVLASLFFLGYTVLATWPQAAHLSSGMVDLLDAKLSAWIFHWDYVQTLRDPANLFQAPILYPAKYVLAFSENMYGAAVFGFPLLAAGASLITNYNVLLLLGMFLSALSAWALARYVTGDPAASLAAGVVYGFLPYKLAQLPHVHMEWGPFLCLVFLFLLRFLDAGRRRDAVFLAIAFAWNAIACIQYAFFTGFLVAVVLVAELVQGRAGTGRRVRGALLAMGIGALAFLPFAIPYRKASDLYRMRRGVSEMTYFSAKPYYFLSAGERNRFWGPLTERFRGPEGDFFPGLLALGLAGVAVARSRNRGSPDRGVEIPAGRRRAARAMDAVILLLALTWPVVAAVPNLRVGPLSLGDAGRVLVFLTLAVLTRLALAFPKRSRYRSLADFLRRQSLDRRVLLLLVVAGVGILVALGGNTPYYRFLFVTFGDVFRAIRVAARGVVLFQVALAVLAAWGLSILTRRRPAAARAGGIALGLAILTLEYRAFPIRLEQYDSGPVPVYEWLRQAEVEGGIVEMPLGFPHDCEYTYRQAEHGKPLVNGHSSFAPKPYEELYPLVHQRPIPGVVWDKLRGLDGRLVILHLDSRAGNGLELLEYLRFVRRGIRDGRVVPIGCFAHGDQVDVILKPTGTPGTAEAAALAAPSPGCSAAEALEAINVADGKIAPPFGLLAVPTEGQTVAPGFWAYGWVLDDSGIADVRVSSDTGATAFAKIGGVWPSLSQVYPDFVEPGNGAYGFGVPELPPGPHVLKVTFVGRDGGETTLERAIMVAPAPSPTPRGPGN